MEGRRGQRPEGGVAAGFIGGDALYGFFDSLGHPGFEGAQPTTRCNGHGRVETVPKNPTRVFDGTKGLFAYGKLIGSAKLGSLFLTLPTRGLSDQLTIPCEE
jgi:hypothetical protein